MPPLTVASFATITHARPSTIPDSRHDPGRRRLAVVELPRGERVQLEKRRAGVDETVDPLPGGQLAARAVPLDRGLSAARGDERGALAKLGDELRHPGFASCERLVADDVGREHRHDDSSVTSTVPDVTWSPTLTSTERTPAS